MPQNNEYRSFYHDQLQFDPVSDDFKLPVGTQMTPDLLTNLIQEHEQTRVPRYRRLEAAYDTKYLIFGEQKHRKPDYRPDNRLAADMAFNMTQTFEGYFIGVPVDIKIKDEAKAEYLKEYSERNSQEEVDSDLSEMCSIYGHCFEMMYQDDEGMPRSVALSPMSAFMVYDDTVLHRPMYFVRYYYDDEAHIGGSYSDANYVTRFSDEGGDMAETDVEEHFFHDVPAVEYRQNRTNRGLFEGVLNLIEAYNKALSEKANDVDYFADAYMFVKGVELTEEHKKDLRDYRLINLYGDGTDGIDCVFMAKPSADATQENLINRLEVLIFKMAMVPDITDDAFSTASGIALKIRLMPMNNLARKKELKFKAAVKRRLRLLASYPNKPFSGDDWQQVEVVMHRNMPEDLESEARIAGQLSGIVSEETQLSILSCVENEEDEIERKESERQSRAESLSGGYPTNRTEEKQDETQGEGESGLREGQDGSERQEGTR